MTRVEPFSLSLPIAVVTSGRSPCVAVGIQRSEAREEAQDDCSRNTCGLAVVLVGRGLAKMQSAFSSVPQLS